MIAADEELRETVDQRRGDRGGRHDGGPPRRPRCSVFIAVSVDGFIARPDGGLDWLDGIHQEGEDFGFQAFFDAVDALVMGRRTYDAVLGDGIRLFEGGGPEIDMEQEQCRSWPSGLVQMRHRIGR